MTKHTSKSKNNDSCGKPNLCVNGIKGYSSVPNYYT